MISIATSQGVSIDRSLAALPLSKQNRIEEPLFGTVLTLDNSVHANARRVLSSRLHRRTSALEPVLERTFAQLVGNYADGCELDIIEDLAEPICETMVAWITGFDLAAVKAMQVPSEKFVSKGFTFGSEFVSPGVLDCVAYLKDAIRRQLMSSLPDETLLEARLASGDRDVASYDINTCLLVITAGLQTTKHSIGNVLATLLEHPKLIEELRTSPTSVPSAVEECLRFDGPSQAVGRVLLRDTFMRDVLLKKGAFVRLALSAANRDPEHFPDPDVPNIHRESCRHLAFGFSQHACLGARITRICLNVVVQGLLNEFPAIELSPRGSERLLGSSLRGYRSYFVTVKRA
ncbi:cytochrome P450 [Rhizobium rhizogenes]|uniref:cytochrome P450 n=1 Tax=Rhizobium rhizogenes TaxID=359 RepID=UPI0005A1F427